MEAIFSNNPIEKNALLVANMSLIDSFTNDIIRMAEQMYTTGLKLTNIILESKKDVEEEDSES